MALAAQGFAEPRRHDGRRDPAAVRPRRAGPDRLGQRPRARALPAGLRPPRRLRPRGLDKAAHYAPRRLFEYWGHEACLIRRRAAAAAALADGARARRGVGRHRRVGRGAARSSLQRGARARARARAARRRATWSTERPQRSGPWWDWSDSKRAIELLFWGGEVTSARRRNFERLYDLPERVLPRAVLDAPTPDEPDAQRELLRDRGARARRRGAAASCATTSGCPTWSSGAPSPSSSRPASCCRSRSRAGRSRPGCTATPASRAASTRARCSARSTT